MRPTRNKRTLHIFFFALDSRRLLFQPVSPSHHIRLLYYYCRLPVLLYVCSTRTNIPTARTVTLSLFSPPHTSTKSPRHPPPVLEHLQAVRPYDNVGPSPGPDRAVPSGEACPSDPILRRAMLAICCIVCARRQKLTVEVVYFFVCFPSNLKYHVY